MVAALLAEQGLLAFESTAVPGQASGGTDQAVARNDDADRVSPVGEPDRPSRAGRQTKDPCGPAVRRGSAVGDGLQGEPDPLLAGSADQPQGYFERRAAVVKVLVQLLGHRRQG